MNAISVAQQFHVEVGESLVAAVVLRSYKAIKLTVVEVCQLILELRALRFEPVRETVADLVNLGIRQLDGLAVRHLYVVAVLILSDGLLDVRHGVVKSVFQKADTVVGTVISSDAKFLPDFHVLARRVT